MKDLSTKMGMSVLLGKNIYNIAELLDKEILKSLVGTDFNWLYDLLNALGRGSIADYTAAVSHHQEYISRFPNVVKEMTHLEQKVRIIAFLELLFQVNKDDRSLSFDRIAQHCHIEKVDVELLLMKSMALGLVKGSIDEVAEVAHINWILPRYLSLSHLQIMSGKLANWENKMENVIRLVEEGASELIQN